MVYSLKLTTWQQVS